MNDAERVIDFIKRELLTAEPEDVPLGEHDNLLKRGPIDSLGVVQLIDFLEQTFDLQIPAGEVTIDNFGSVSRMIAYLDDKRGATSGGGSA